MLLITQDNQENIILHTPTKKNKSTIKKSG